MASTSRLYYQDSYASAFEAKVVEASPDRKRIYLDKTFFYPASGGQPHDMGTLAGLPVVGVIDEGEQIAHLLAEPVLTETVSAQIDWLRRYDHMQQHTGQHLLSAVLVEVCGVPTLSFHMGDQVSTIELGTKELNYYQVDAVEDRVNEIVREGRNVQVSYEEANQAQALRKESSRTGTLRIVEIAGIDRSACGGTHVRSTAELGPIQIRNQEKVRGNVRIEFVCGRRALHRSKNDFRLLAQLVRESATIPENLPEHVKLLKEKLLEAEKEQTRLTAQLAEQEAMRLYQSVEPSSAGVRFVFQQIPFIDARTRAVASCITTSSKAALLVLAEKPPSVLLACSSDSGLNAGATLKELLSQVGGRGGGSPTLAQGSLPNIEAGEQIRKSLGMSESLAGTPGSNHPETT